MQEGFHPSEQQGEHPKGEEKKARAPKNEKVFIPTGSPQEQLELDSDMLKEKYDLSLQHISMSDSGIDISYGVPEGTEKGLVKKILAEEKGLGTRVKIMLIEYADPEEGGQLEIDSGMLRKEYGLSLQRVSMSDSEINIGYRVPEGTDKELVRKILDEGNLRDGSIAKCILEEYLEFGA